MQDLTDGVNIPVGGFIDAAKAPWLDAAAVGLGRRDPVELRHPRRLRAHRRRHRATTCALRRWRRPGRHLPRPARRRGGRSTPTTAKASCWPAARHRRAGKLPIVASLDLHANVTHRMLREADALVSLPHLPACGHGAHRRAGRAAAGPPAARPAARAAACAAPALPDPAECAEHLDAAGPGPVRGAGRAGQAPRHGAELLHGLSGQRLRRVRAHGLGPWRTAPKPGGGGSSARAGGRSGAVAPGRTAGARGRGPGAGAGRAGQQAGGHRRHAGQPRRRRRQQHHRPAACAAAQGAGRRFPGQVALGLLFDPPPAAPRMPPAWAPQLDLALGTAVPTFTGQA
jgi:hypothetical protein